MYNLRQQNYQLRFAPENMQRNNLSAFLIDNYLSSRTPISLTDSSFVNIQITAAAGSSKPDRFYLVFERKQINEPTNPRKPAELFNSPAITKNEGDAAASVSVYPNPVVNKIIHLQFTNKSTGRYSVQLNSQQGQQLYKQTILINETNSNKAVQLPKGLAAGTYQLTVAGLDGTVNVLNVVIQ